jgi:DeoR family transcriptional regulator, suf operon transcriptional repressor
LTEFIIVDILYVMTTTRDIVLRVLLTRQHCTLNELAEVVGISPISMRHHIARLEADGLLTAVEERHGVGRPRMVYTLTESGLERFPTRYVRLTLRLLEQLKETMPAPMVNNLFTQMAKEMADDLAAQSDLQDLPIEERLIKMQRFLESEGFTINWERQGNQYLIREVNCPYFHVGQSHPEVCAVDQTLISAALSVPAEKVKCILNGDSVCTYVVTSQTEVPS